MKIGINLSILVLIGLSQVATAVTQDENDWAHILGQVRDNQTGEVGFLYDTNEQRSGTLYSASIDYQFRNGDSDGDFSSSESVFVTITSPSGKKLSTEKYMTPKELSDWADKHKKQLLKAVFGTDPRATVSRTTTSVATASNEIIHLSTVTRQRQRATRANRAIRAKSKAKKSKKATQAKAFNSGFSSLVVMDSEKATMHSNGIRGTSSAFKFSYDTELESGNDLGTLFSYRKTKASDVYGSKSTTISLSPYYKYYHTINDKVEVMGVGNLLINKQSLDSSLFNDFTYLEYGAGLSAIPSYYVNDKLSFSLPIGVQTVKKRITSSVPDSIDFIVHAINNLGFQTSINYGLGAEYAIKPNWYANLNIIRTQEISSDTSYNKDKATYYNIGMTYYSELFNYRIGYKTVKNITNYDEDAYMLSAQYNW